MRSRGVCASRQQRRSGTVRVVEMASICQLSKRRQRSSSSTISIENHGEEDGRVKLKGEMDDDDLEFGSPKKRMRSVMSLQVCASRDEAEENTKTSRGSDCEFEVELEEGNRELVAKSSTEMFNKKKHGLRSSALPVSNMSTDVIRALVPRKVRSACVKRSLQEYPASGCHKHQSHSDLEAGENGVRTEGCKSSIQKGGNLSSSEDKDTEMEVAEVLLSLMKKTHQPENARNSLQGLGAILVRESEHINADVKLWPGKKKPEQVEKTGGSDSELKLLENHRVSDTFENAETSILKDGLVKESKKDKSLSHTNFSLSFESGNSVDMKENHMHPLAEYQTEILEIDIMRTKERTKMHMPDVTEGKQENDLQPRRVYQDGLKRCATHYYIAKSIIYHHQCNITKLLSSDDGSAHSSVNGSSKKVVSERQLQGLILNGSIATKSPKVVNPWCPQNREAATEADRLPNSAQRAQHLNHKALQVSSPEKKVYQMVGPKVERPGTHASSTKTALPMKNAFSAGDITTCSTFLKMDPSMTFYNLPQETNEGPPFMTITPNNDHALPTSTTIGNSAPFKGSVHGNGTPYFNGTVCPPQMFYPQLLNQQPTHPQNLILPTTGLSRSSSLDKQPCQMPQHGLNVGGHKFLQSAATQSHYLQKKNIHSFRHSHKPEVETPDKKPVVDNSVCGGQRSAQKQHSQATFKQMHFTRTPIAARNSKARKFENEELVQRPKVESELPASQPVSLSYIPYDVSSIPSEEIFSLPKQNYPFHPSQADVARQGYFGPQTAGVVYKNYRVRGKGGLDTTEADSARNAFTGNPSSCLIQSSAMSKEIRYNHTAMLKGCSMFDKSDKTPSFYSASNNANSQNHYGAKQHYAQEVWNRTLTTNAQTSSSISTNVPYHPFKMSHPASWSNLRTSQFPQSASTLPTISYNPWYPVSHSSTYEGNNDKLIPDQVKGISAIHPPPTLANNPHSLSSNSCQPSFNGIQSGSVVSPNVAGPNSSNQQKVSSPVCRMVVPSILSSCPGQVREVKN